MTDTQVFASMYERIGGAVTIDHLVESFYRRMDALPEVQIVRAKHAADLDSTKRVLKRCLTEWMGRPKLIRPRKATRGCARAIFGFPIARSAAGDGLGRADLDLARFQGSPTGCATRPAIPMMRGRRPIHSALIVSIYPQIRSTTSP
jgi:hypothetical protein